MHAVRHGFAAGSGQSATHCSVLHLVRVDTNTKTQEAPGKPPLNSLVITSNPVKRSTK